MGWWVGSLTSTLAPPAIHPYLGKVYLHLKIVTNLKLFDENDIVDLILLSIYVRFFMECTKGPSWMMIENSRCFKYN